MNWEIRQKCDLAAGTYQSWGDSTYAYTGDNNAHSWVVEVFSSGSAADLSGYSVNAYFIRADGNTVIATGSISQNTVNVELPQSCYSVPGVVKGAVKITKSGSTVTVGAIKFSVSVSSTDTLIDPENIVPSVDELLSILAEIDQIADAEQERVEAEQERVIAEEEREATIAQIEQNAESGEYDGATFTPAVSAAGVISWSNDKGLANPASVNIKGPQGPQGPQGAPGAKGDKGDKGDTGDSGVYLGNTEPTDESVKVWINPDGESSPISDDDAVGTKPWSSLQIIDTLCPPLEVAGNPVQCYPVANYPLGVKASWEPRQEGSGDPSPENVRPIVGLDSVKVTRCGKNLLPYTKPSNPVYSSNGITYTWHDDGSIHVAGTSTAIADSKVMNFSGFYLPPGNYVFGSTGISGLSLHLVVQKASTGSNTWYSGNVSIEPGDVPQYFYISCQSGVTVDTTVYAFLTYGDNTLTANDYAPYTGTTATLTLPETIYGGELDAVTGEGSEEWEVISFDGTENWMLSGNNILFYVHNINYSISEEGLCSHFKYFVSAAGDGIYCIVIGITMTVALGSVLSGQYTVDTWKSYLAAQFAAGTPVTIAYKLATPTSFQATGGQSLPALPGTNTIYTDADSVTVTGRADPVQTINALNDRIAALEDAATGG